MFDSIDIREVIPCVHCGAELRWWQSKDADCVIDELPYWKVKNFYCMCDRCDTWHEFDRKPYIKRYKPSLLAYVLTVEIENEHPRVKVRDLPGYTGKKFG